MTTRLRWLRAPSWTWLLLAAVGWFLVPGLPSTVRAETESLQETLENGLKARRPEEFAFIARVVRLVDQGTLPRSLVETTYLWARRKRTVPYPYFEKGLRVRAQRIGIEL
ncbi:MAG: hypothetical protein GTO03_04395 [Planctomycetales bacterium]|nr:hypothetical protein [Planctomycetales bacterium]